MHLRVQLLQRAVLQPGYLRVLVIFHLVHFLLLMHGSVHTDGAQKADAIAAIDGNAWCVEELWIRRGCDDLA